MCGKLFLACLQNRSSSQCRVQGKCARSATDSQGDVASAELHLKKWLYARAFLGGDRLEHVALNARSFEGSPAALQAGIASEEFLDEWVRIRQEKKLQQTHAQFCHTEPGLLHDMPRTTFGSSSH